MAEHKYFKVRTIQVVTNPDGNLFGVPIVCPCDCSKIVIENTDTGIDMWMRSDPADGATTKTIPKQLELTIGVGGAASTPYMAGDIIGYLAPASGGPLVAVVTYTR